MILRQAVQTLQTGGVIAYPTEGVWGLGCEPMNRHAVERLLALKRRDWRKGLILIASDFSQLEPYVAPVTASQLMQARATWPGPYTWLFPASPGVPAIVTGGRESVAVRVSAHPRVVELCRAYGGAIVSTSANISRRSPVRSAVQARRLFGDAVTVVAGELGGLLTPTPIRDVRSGVTIRA